MDQSILNALSDDVTAAGYLKAGFLGFNKSGKSFTAALLALATRQHFGLSGPIAHMDTENGSIYLTPLMKQFGLEPGTGYLAKRDRSFDGMMRWGEACVKAGVSVALVDSITHPWRELCDSYLAKINENGRQRFKGNWRERKKLEFQDWSVIKPRWETWSTFYLNSPLHIIICGRAGWEYEFVQSEEDGKKELQKTGIKMKTESEFGFEPSLLVEMERDQVVGEHTQIVRRAIVLGDRFSVIDGKRIDFTSINVDDQKAVLAGFNRVYHFFKPHLDKLTPGSHPQIDTSLKSDFKMDGGDEVWRHEQKQRQIFCEEIQGELLRIWPGQSAAEKKAKADILQQVFNTRSWTKVEGTDAATLREGLKTIRELHPQPIDDPVLHQTETTP